MKGLFSKLAIATAVAVLFSACGDDKKAEEAAPQAVEEQVTIESYSVGTDTAAPEADTEASTQESADQNTEETAQENAEEASEQAPKTEEAK